MNIYFIPLAIILIIILLVIFVELFTSVFRNIERSSTYLLAKKRAKETGRPLIVIGDPHNGFGTNMLGVSYGIGDYMIDMFPCKKCLKSPNTFAQDLIEALKTFKSDSCVIYTSCVLEFVPDMEGSIAEIFRVAGHHTNVFVVHIQPYCPVAYGYLCPKSIIKHDGSRRVIKLAPPEFPTFIYKNF